MRMLSALERLSFPLLRKAVSRGLGGLAGRLSDDLLSSCFLKVTLWPEARTGSIQMNADTIHKPTAGWKPWAVLRKSKQHLSIVSGQK